MRYRYDEDRKSIIATTPGGDFLISDAEAAEAQESLKAALVHQREHRRRIAENTHSLYDFEETA